MEKELNLQTGKQILKNRGNRLTRKIKREKQLKRKNKAGPPTQMQELP